jgi:RNA polymerase sigma-70 factor, ECF subfamily
VVTAVEEVFRNAWAGCSRRWWARLGDLDVAEDVSQEAFAIAAERWPRDGEPDHRVAWLVTTARNRALNRIRRDRTFAVKAYLFRDPAADEPVGPEPDVPSESLIADERLELMCWVSA